MVRPDGALNKYQEQRDDLHAGRKPRQDGDGLEVRDLLNRFLTAKRHLLDTREITQRTFDDYQASCARIGASFGLTRRPGGLQSHNFFLAMRSMACSTSQAKASARARRGRASSGSALARSTVTTALSSTAKPSATRGRVL